MNQYPKHHANRSPIAAGIFSVVLCAASTAWAQGFVFGTAPATKPVPAQAGERDAKVETAQRLLIRLGLLKESPSGMLTPATRDAIRDFSGQHGLGTVTQVNEVLLNTLRKVIWQSQNYASGNYKGREKIVDANGLREAQQLLSRLGFNPGPHDGTFGPQTQVATEAFQESQGVTVDGLITPTVLMNLRRALNGIGSGTKDVLRVLNWPDYIDPSVLVDFEREYKIRVAYDIFSGNDDLIDKLGSKASYDVVFPTANAVPAMAGRGLLAKLDKASLRNLGNIDPRVDAALRTWDKDGAYSIPYMWYTVGIAWNSKQVARAAPGHKMDLIANVLDPENARKFASCGIGVVDSATDIVPLAAMTAGQSKWEGKASINAAEKVLDRIAGLVKVIPTDQFVTALAEGKYCVVLGFSGDAVQAQNKSRGNLEYRVPADGGLLAIDAMAVPVSATNKKAAHQFIDYLMRPQVIAKVSNTVGYANANVKAGEFMAENVRNNPAVVPSAESLSRSMPIPILSDQDQQDISRIWTRFAK